MWLQMWLQMWLLRVPFRVRVSAHPLRGLVGGRYRCCAATGQQQRKPEINQLEVVGLRDHDLTSRVRSGGYRCGYR